VLVAAGQGSAEVDPAAAELAHFGRALLAFERGDVPSALEENLVLLEQAAAAPARPADARASSVRAMAAGRLGILLEERSGGGRARIEERILALLPAPLWSWQTRRELALQADGIARRRDDAELLARVGATAGCVRDIRLGQRLGFLPHVDLDREPPAAAVDDRAAPAAPSRRAHTLGCRISVPVDPSRPGAERVFAELEVPPAPGGAGGPPAQARAFDLVVESAGEARLLVDGGATARHTHGGAFRFGPRISVLRVSLTPGRHGLELRLASDGGRPTISLFAFPVAASEPARGGLPRPPEPLRGTPSADDAAAAVAELYVANRLGDGPAVWQLADRLEALPRFAVGRAVLAAARRDDPSVPANVARDRARTLWLEALAQDGELARPRQSLAGLDLEDERPRSAIDNARAAASAHPPGGRATTLGTSPAGWWLPELTLFAAYRLRGLDFDADQALARAVELGGESCAVIESALGHAEDRRDAAGEARWTAALAGCPSRLDLRLESLRKRGALPEAVNVLRRAIRLSPDSVELEAELASALLTLGRAAEAAEVLARVVAPSDVEGQLHLADALTAAGQRERARGVVTALLARRPDAMEAVHAARLLGIPLPLDAFRLDGRRVIREFETSGRTYQAPAVVVLDRTVTRLLPDGTELTLTHEIVRVQSKDAIEKWGEISLPEHAEVLTVRTHKADGSTREPEEVAGKDSVSAADLGIGDYVEKETLELRAPDEAFLRTRGFVGDRFYFQSFDAPLDRTEYLVVTDASEAARLHWDARAGAPAPEDEDRQEERPRLEGRPKDEDAGGRPPGRLRITTFARRAVPQRFAERSAVPAIEIVPSVRGWRGVTWRAWADFLREQTYGNARASAELLAAAEAVRHQAGAGASPEALAAALVTWTGTHVEDGEDLRESAAFSLARGRGNRVAVIHALARLLGLRVDTVLARSRLTVPALEPPVESEVDDFSEPLLRFRLPEEVFVDARLKHAPLGYLPPSLDGAPFLSLEPGRPAPGAAEAEVAAVGRFGTAHGAGVPDTRDGRVVDLALRLDASGAGRAEVREELRGWPALEWAEILDRLGGDRDKIRQDFEQRWLGVQFGGAVLEDLTIDVLGADGRLVSRRIFLAGLAGPSPEGSGPGLSKPGTVPEAESAPASTVLLPDGPYVAASVRLLYTFSSARMATAAGGELRFQPTFFRSQPGRRYAAEPARHTALVMGPEFPFELRARIELPPGASVEALTDRLAVTRPGGYEFVEQRSVDPEREGTDVTARALHLNRKARIPILRVAPGDYAEIAQELRRVDSAEQREVRFRLGRSSGRRATAAGAPASSVGP